MSNDNSMKVIIAGSRSIENYNLVKEVIIDSSFHITEIISGAAKGVDMLGIRYAIEKGITIKLFKITKRDWQIKGKAAGCIRNKMMGDYADALIAIWDNRSNGTRHMINYAKQKGLQFFVRIV